MRTRAAEQNRETSIRRRRLVSTLLLLGALIVVGRIAPARAAETSRVRIDVVELSGLLDPVTVDFALRAVRDAEVGGAEVLVVRLDSTGSVAPEDDLRRLVAKVGAAEVPVAIWVGPGREARASGDAFDLFAAADVRGAAPRSWVGGQSAEAALDRGVVTVSAPTLVDFIGLLDGAAGIDVPTVRADGSGDEPGRRQLAPEALVRFHEPSLLAQLLHAVSTPSAAYVLLVLGLLLVVFEFFTAGVGVAGAVGVIALVLGVLPTRPLALAAIAVGVVGYAIDVQSGAPRAWTAIGTVVFVAGSSFLLGDGLSVPLPVLAIVVAGVALLMVAGMPAMIRTRFSTATIGRESMLGEEGTAVSDVDPDGVVTIRDAPWRARTNRATPIRAGETIRVAGIDGLLLEVEPLEGAARDAGH